MLDECPQETFHFLLSSDGKTGELQTFGETTPIDREHWRWSRCGIAVNGFKGQNRGHDP